MLEINNKRVDWIDVAKGFTILLVIIGHSVGGGLRGIIFSFHMPLFFILSCATYKLSIDNADLLVKFEKSFKHLFLPTLGIYFCGFLIGVVKDVSFLQGYSLKELKIYFAEKINVFVVGSGAQTVIGDLTVPALGIPWFLLVLFLGRTLYDYIHLKLPNKKVFYFSIALSSIIGVCFGFVQWLPFSFDIALAIQPLLLFGFMLKKIDMEKLCFKICALSFILWSGSVVCIYLISGNYMELAYRRYSGYPLCFICAIAGTMFISAFSQIFLCLKGISIPIKYLGKNSMYMLWVHCFDYQVSFLYNLTANSFLNAMLRILIDVAIFIVVMNVIEKVKRFKR